MRKRIRGRRGSSMLVVGIEPPVYDNEFSFGRWPITELFFPAEVTIERADDGGYEWEPSHPVYPNEIATDDPNVRIVIKP